MDYGPTIAAAFAARQEEMIQSEYYKNNKDKSNHDDEEYGGMNTANDVSALRKIILGCMRNARDQALIASHERTERPREAEYQGRYAEDATTQGRAGRDEGSPEKFLTASKSSKAGIYHQAFAGKKCRICLLSCFHYDNIQFIILIFNSQLKAVEGGSIREK